VRWWHSIEPNVAGVERYGERAVVESIIGGIERKVRTMGVKLWMHLDGRERSVLATCVPSLYKRAMADLRRQHYTQKAEAEEITRRMPSSRSM